MKRKGGADRDLALYREAQCVAAKCVEGANCGEFSLTPAHG